MLRRRRKGVQERIGVRSTWLKRRIGSEVFRNRWGKTRRAAERRTVFVRGTSGGEDIAKDVKSPRLRFVRLLYGRPCLMRAVDIRGISSEMHRERRWDIQRNQSGTTKMTFGGNFPLTERAALSMTPPWPP
jgi:hypothetical protein